MNDSFIHRDFLEVVSTGITTLADTVVSTLCCFAGRKVQSDASQQDAQVVAKINKARPLIRSQQVNKNVEGPVRDNFQQCRSLIAQLIPQDSNNGHLTNESFSNFLESQKSKLQFLKDTENVVNLFQRFQWDVNKMPAEWQKALKETQKTRKNKDVDVLTIADVRLTQEQLKAIARHIPNVKKLDVKNSFVDREIVELSRTLFPKLKEITYTNVLEPATNVLLGPVGIGLGGSMGDEGYESVVVSYEKNVAEIFDLTSEGRSRFSVLDKDSIPQALQGGQIGQLIVDDKEPVISISSIFVTYHADLAHKYYSHLPGTMTIKIEP